jgi:hypothetical protein
MDGKTCRTGATGLVAALGNSGNMAVAAQCKHPLSSTEHIMSKSQDSKKAVKKEPAKSPKEKKEAKKIKKEATKRQ